MTYDLPSEPFLSVEFSAIKYIPVVVHHTHTSFHLVELKPLTVSTGLCYSPSCLLVGWVEVQSTVVQVGVLVSSLLPA